MVAHWKKSLALIIGILMENEQIKIFFLVKPRILVQVIRDI